MLRFLVRNKSDLDEVIDMLLARMKEADPNSPEYFKLVQHLDKLTRLKESNKSRVSKDTIAIVAGNILVVLIVVGYEHGHVVVSKALQFMLKSQR